ncbi:MAG: arsenic transporter [Deltaproteobacteria bacterium]|nr:arsenic transporter [Deltaproteobacteria bacterium]
MSLPGLLIFALTYVLISARRLRWLGFDRPAGALLGAVACVVAGVLTPMAAIEAVDGATLLLLLGVMGMGAFLAVDGFFDQLEPRLVALAVSPSRLLGLTVWGSGLLAALITNDAVCVLGAPLIVRLIQRHSLPPLPFLLALATGANTGSVATLVGNPQNMLCGILGGLSYREYLLLMAPVAALGLSINHGLLWLSFRRSLAEATLSKPTASAPIAPRALLTLSVIAGSAVAYTLGGHLAWTAAAGFVLLMLLHRRDTRALWPHIDWSLLLFFAGLFIVVEGLTTSGAPAVFFDRFPLSASGDGIWGWLRLSAIFLVGSNVVSNVPFILVIREQMATLPNPRLGWELLAMASTFAGNLTLLGSVANIIVAEASHELGGLPFWPYLRVGFPLAVVTTAVGVLWVLMMT